MKQKEISQGPRGSFFLFFFFLFSFSFNKQTSSSSSSSSSSSLLSSSIQILPSMSLYDDIGEAPPYPEEKDADLLQKYNVPFDDSKLSSFFF